MCKSTSTPEYHWDNERHAFVVKWRDGGHRRQISHSVSQHGSHGKAHVACLMTMAEIIDAKYAAQFRPAPPKSKKAGGRPPRGLVSLETLHALLDHVLDTDGFPPWAMLRVLSRYGHRPVSLCMSRCEDFSIVDGIGWLRLRIKDHRGGRRWHSHPVLGEDVPTFSKLIDGRAPRAPLFSAPCGGRWEVLSSKAIPHGRANQLTQWIRRKQAACGWAQRGEMVLKDRAVASMRSGKDGWPRPMDLSDVVEITGHRSPMIIANHYVSSSPDRKISLVT